MRVIAVLLAALLSVSACGNGPEDPDGQQPGDSPTSASSENVMNIDEATQHYEELYADLKKSLRCGDKSLEWRELEPAAKEPTGEIDGAGNATAYVYRAPFIGADGSCNVTASDLNAVVDQLNEVLQRHGGVADDAAVSDGVGPGQTAEVKLRDELGATLTFSTGKRTSISLVSAELPAK